MLTSLARPPRTPSYPLFPAPLTVHLYMHIFYIQTLLGPPPILPEESENIESEVTRAAIFLAPTGTEVCSLVLSAPRFKPLFRALSIYCVLAQISFCPTSLAGFSFLFPIAPSVSCKLAHPPIRHALAVGGIAQGALL